MTPRTRTASFLAALLALGAIAVVLVFSPQPKVAVTADTHVWASEFDARRQNSIQPGPGIPLASIKAGEPLRVIRVVDGKDSVAAEVETPSGQRGWVLLYGQKGIRVET